MKLALVTQHYAPDFEGGTETVVRAQATAFAELGHRVLVVAGTDRAPRATDVLRERVDGLEVCLLPRLADEPYDLALERPRLRALVRSLVGESDLVHLHHWSTLDARLVRSLAAERPVVVTLHDLFVTCPRFFRQPEHGVPRCPEPGDLEPCVACVGPDLPGLGRAELHERLRARQAGFAAELDAAALVVAPSASHLERVRAWVPLPSGRTAVVPHGLSRAFPAAAGAALPFGAGDVLRVGFLGHRARIKGPLDLVEALAGLEPALRARVELVFLGSAVEPGIDERLRAQAQGLRLSFEPPYALAELPERVRASGGLHLAVLPSRAYESYGLVVDEALALGLPVWVSDRGAPRERVGGAGLVLPVADPPAWRAAFRALLSDPTVLARQRRALPARVRSARDAASELAVRFEELLERTA